MAGNTSVTLSGQPNLGDADAFLRKYDAQGTELWTRQLGSTAYDVALSLALTRNGGIVLAGTTTGALPGKTSFGAHDVYVARYDADGAELWTRQLGSTGNDEASAVSVDARGSVLVGGGTNLALPGQSHFGERDAFALKLIDPTIEAPVLAAP